MVAFLQVVKQMKDDRIKHIIITVLAILLLIGLYFLFKFLTKKEETRIEYLRDYSVNEYIPTYDSQFKIWMAKQHWIRRRRMKL